MMNVPEIWSTTDRIFSHFRPFFALLWHGIKVGPGSQDLESQAPETQNLGPPSKFKSGNQDPLKI